MLSKKLSLLSISVVIAAMSLAGCEESKEKEKDMSEAGFGKVERVLKSDEKSFEFKRGLYLTCIEKEAYLVGAQDTSMIVKILNKNNPVMCRTDKNSSRYLTSSLGIEISKVCVGGYEFLVLSEERRGDYILQSFNPSGEAKFCMPNINASTSFENMEIVHPSLEAKAKEIQNILNAGEPSGAKTGIY